MVEWFLTQVQRHSILSILPIYKSNNYVFRPAIINQISMSNTFITTDDLQEFKTELLQDIKNIIKSPNNQGAKKYLKSFEVKQMLSISSGTLHNLRINGTLPFTRVSNVLLYDLDDIITILETNKENV